MRSAHRGGSRPAGSQPVDRRRQLRRNDCGRDRAGACVAPTARPARARQPMRPALVLFCAEQGFAGAFSERVLDVVSADLAKSELFLIGTPGGIAAAERNVTAGWKTPMPSHSLGIPRLADTIAQALYTPSRQRRNRATRCCLQRTPAGPRDRGAAPPLFPFDAAQFPPPSDTNAPIVNLRRKLCCARLRRIICMHSSATPRSMPSRRRTKRVWKHGGGT